MRFHTTAVIHTHDPSKVWPSLELALREVTIEATRSGNLMMLRGLGTSSVSMNHDDFAILTVEEHEDEVFIEADGVFDGSYLGADISPEEEVRSKLDRVFNEIQRQFYVEETATPVVPVTPVVVETKVKEAEVPRKSVIQTVRLDSISISPFLNGSKRSEPKVSASTVKTPELPARRLTDIPHANFRHFSYVAASIPVLVLAIAGMYGAERYLEQREANNASPANSQPAATHVDSRSAVSVVPAIPLPAPTQSADHSADPQTLLNRWGSAMRTRDAVAQSSFYADPVDRYQNQALVTRTVLQQEKQAAIADRKGLWTVKLEGIVIEKRTADEVSVRLVKHFIDQPGPSQISEEFVPTQLLLRRVDGDWRIVSERDLAPLANPVKSIKSTVSIPGSKFES